MVSQTARTQLVLERAPQRPYLNEVSPEHVPALTQSQPHNAGRSAINRLMTIPQAAKQRLKIMLLAKHAAKDGHPDAEDGNHAVYHHEMRTTLEQIGLNLVVADRYDALDSRPDADFVIPLLNRGGFVHSEMLAPLQLTRHGVPFLGAAPIIRGLTDDKHLTKLVARARGVPTAEWSFVRVGTDPVEFAAERLVVKPNTSSASWGVEVCGDWHAARSHIRWIHDHGHDAIVEAWMPAIDIAVPVIGGLNGQPWILPLMAYTAEDGNTLRSYEEKRGLKPGAELEPQAVTDPVLVTRLEAAIAPLLQEFWPFDYGRFEFRYDPSTGALSFMEVNLSCNLWSRKTIAKSARTLGISHAQVVEHIVAHSLGRHRLIPATRVCPLY